MAVGAMVLAHRTAGLGLAPRSAPGPRLEALAPSAVPAARPLRSAPCSLKRAARTGRGAGNGSAAPHGGDSDRTPNGSMGSAPNEGDVKREPTGQRSGDELRNGLQALGAGHSVFFAN